MDDASQKVVRRRQNLARRFLKSILELIKGHFIASYRQALVRVELLIPLQESLSSKIPYIACGDELQLLILHQLHRPTGRKHLSEEVWREIVEERDGAQYRPNHIVARSLGLEMLLNVILGDEVRHICRVAVGSRTATINR